MNLTGTKVQETGQYCILDAYTGDMNLTIVGIHTVQSDNGGTTSWEHQDCVNATCDDQTSAWTYTNSNDEYDGSSRTMVTTPDVSLSLPDDGSVKVQMGNQVVVPLTITPILDEFTGLPTKIGFEFEVRFDSQQLQFIDVKQDYCWSLSYLSK